MTERLAPAKINLALVVGPTRDDGRHDVVTVLQRISLADRIRLEPAEELRVDGFEEDTIVRRALEGLAAEAGTEPSWHVTIDKHIPVAAGLGGGSADAGTALQLANETLRRPLDGRGLHVLAQGLGADVPFFLTAGPQLGEADGTELQPLSLTQDYWILLVLPHESRKESTAAVYDRFTGEDGFAERRAALLRGLALGDLATLPPNDLASSPIADDLRELGAFRADVTGAGPTVYGLFAEQGDALQSACRAGRPRPDVDRDPCLVASAAMIEQPVLEARPEGSLRRNRLRIALGIAVVEGLLLVFGFLDRWATLLVAAVIIVGYFALASRLRAGPARDVAWIAAVSQALVALIPILLIVVGTLALIAVGILAVVALIVLFGDRR